MTCLLRPALTSVRFGSTLAFIPSPSRSGRPTQRPGSRPSSPPCGSAARARWRSRRSAAMRASCAMALIEAEVKVFLVNPRRIKAFRAAEGLIAKTDKLDASLIARFAHAMAHELRPLTGRRARDPEGSVDATAAADGIDRHREDAPQTGLRPVDPRIVSGDDRHSRRQAPNDRSRVRSPHRGRRQNGAPARHSGFDPGIATRISTLVVVEMPELGLIDRKAAASPGGPCAPSLAIRPGSRTQRHLRRPSLRALSLLHGRARRGANPSPLQAGLPRPARRRKTRKSRPRRRRSTHRHPRQRPPPRRHNLQKRKLRLTSPIQSPGAAGRPTIPGLLRFARNDGVDGPAQAASSAKTWSLERHKWGDRP